MTATDSHRSKQILREVHHALWAGPKSTIQGFEPSVKQCDPDAT